MLHRKVDWSSRLVAVLVFLPAFLVALALFHPALVVEGQAHAPAAVAADRDWDEKCSLETLEGTYGDFEQGTVLAPFPGFPPPPFPVVLSGIVTYDGAGHISATYTASFGGMILPATATGKYIVKPDCTYSDTITEPNGPGGHHVGTITGEGMLQEVHFVYTDPWLVASGTLKKTPRRGCSQETLEGTYAIFGQGLATLPNLPPFLPVAHVGTFTADGDGHFSGEDTITIAGKTKADAFTAEYIVKPDCSFTSAITTSIGVVNEAGVITGVGRFQETHTIYTNQGWVAAETGKKQ